MAQSLQQAMVPIAQIFGRTEFSGLAAASATAANAIANYSQEGYFKESEEFAGYGCVVAAEGTLAR
jgi:hypothetical protein